MRIVSLSVTEASRNFADCINRARYQGTTFVLHKNGVAVARIVPEGSGAAEAEARTEAETAPPPTVPTAAEPPQSQNVFPQPTPEERTPERTAPVSESGVRPPVKRYDIW